MRLGRRDAIRAMGAMLAGAPLRTLAQSPRRVGVLMVNAPDDKEQLARLAQFRERLASLGWKEGQNVSFDVRWSAGNMARAQAQVHEMVASRPDVIVSSSTPVTVALQKETTAVPVVFIFVADPVGSGLIKTLPRPGGNITGLVNIDPSLIEKWLELLKNIAPAVGHVAVMFNPETAPYAGPYLRRLDAVAGAIGVRASLLRVRSAADIEAAVAALGPGSGLVAMADSFLAVHRRVLVGAAARHKVPAIYFSDVHVAEGGLLSYGIDAADLFQRAAPYVDRILRGARPAELPVEQPSKFTLAINAKTAAALGLVVPRELLLRADRVFE